jgi:hypothetical protein
VAALEFTVNLPTRVCALVLPGINKALGALVLQFFGSAATSMPARATLTSTCSESPPSRGIALPI